MLHWFIRRFKSYTFLPPYTRKQVLERGLTHSEAGKSFSHIYPHKVCIFWDYIIIITCLQQQLNIKNNNSRAAQTNNSTHKNQNAIKTYFYTHLLSDCSSNKITTKVMWGDILLYQSRSKRTKMSRVQKIFCPVVQDWFLYYNIAK